MPSALNLGSNWLKKKIKLFPFCSDFFLFSNPFLTGLYVKIVSFSIILIRKATFSGVASVKPRVYYQIGI